MCLCGVGRYCETDVDYCSSSPCLNNATCLDLVDSFRCLCPAGLTGARCGTSLDACSSSPCQHDAVCRYLGACTCSEVLRTCADHDEPCQRSECARRAPRCQVRAASFACDCAGTGFTGALCDEDVDECLEEERCLHGGRCVNAAGSYTCQCSRTGFTGSRCQLDVDECTADDQPVCHNGGQ